MEAREAVEHPSVPRSAPQQRITCRPNVNSSEFEKPCYSHFGGYFIDFPALIVIQLFSKLCFCCVSIIFSLAILGTATSLRLLQIPYMNCMEKNLNLEKIILFSLDSPPYSVVKLNLHLLLFDSTQGLSLLEVKDQLLLMYLMDLSHLILDKASGGSLQGHPAVLRLVEIRTV